MAYQTILVHIDDTPRCAARVELASDLAAAGNAHLVGLYLPVLPADLSYAVINRQNLQAALDRQTISDQHHEQDARQKFEAIAARAGATAEWRAPQGLADDLAALHARHADLIVLGQHDGQAPAAPVAERFNENLILASGRPVLVVPYTGPVPHRFRSILIAWNGSRESARAVGDAMPLLERADRVTAAIIDPTNVEPRLDAPNTNALIDYLSRHGVSAAFEAIPASHEVGVDKAGVGELLLTRAADVAADLIVMGCYGHARLRELVMGGVTRTLLRSMTVPTLLSH
ncbi:MAG: universal stress protein [Pandoraea sp.]|nr:MAG: universal stress protein [Pandoraea sp.]TAM20656.1 MAG: universal stress protein [Pandoraea sp.]